MQRSPAPWLPWALGLLTLLALATRVPREEVAALYVDPRVSIIMIGLVAFIVNVEVPLLRDSISLGYAAGLMVFLALGHPNRAFEAFTIIAIGSVLGGAIRAWWLARQSARNGGNGNRIRRRIIEHPLMATAQLTLSMVVSGYIYRQLFGGRLPLDNLGVSDIVPLLVLLIVSISLYLGLYALAVWWRGLKVAEVFLQNQWTIALTVLLPLPFVVVAALTYHASFAAFVILMIGLLGMAIGATELGRGQLRFRQQVVELQSLSAVNRAMRTHLDLGALLETIHLQVATLLEVHAFTLALYDADRNLVTFPLVTWHWQRINVLPRELGMDVIDHVIASKAPLLLAQNPAQQARRMALIPPDEHLTSWLGVPLLAPDRALGCIAVAMDEPERSFTDHEQRLLVAIATQSSIAIENAQLYRQVQERARQLTRLNNLSAQLSGTLDPTRVLEAVAQATVTVAEASGAAVFLWWDEAKKTLGLAQTAGLSQDFANDAPLPLSLSDGLQPLVIQNARLDSRAAGIFDLMRREQINAWIELPMLHGERALGVLVAYYRNPRSFSGDETELLRTFANQAALAISNARQYRQTDDALERRVDQLSALASINKELSSALLNLNNIFRLVLDRAIDSTRSSSGMLLVRGENEDVPRLVARRGDARLKTSELMRLHIVSQAFVIGQPVVERDLKQMNGVVARLSVPLVRDYDVLGVITLESQMANAYGAEEIEFVSQLANLATIAIDNARVFEWVQDSRNRLQVILDSMNEAVILFDPDGKAVLANPRVSTLLGLDPTLIIGERLEVMQSRADLIFAERLGFSSRAELTQLFQALKLSTWQGSAKVSYRIDRPQTRFIDRNIVAVFDQSRKVMGLLMVFTDATEERELTQAREDLSRMIVHDLRSPLTAISTSLKLLNEMAPPDDDPLGRSIRKTTEVSLRALRKLLHLVDSLLDIAKMESGNMTLETSRHELKPIADNVRFELSPLAEELNIRVDVLIPDNIPPLMIDSNKVERVLLNLVDNALKFTPVDGLVEIRAECDDNKLVRIRVTDTGPGIPDEHKARIFDRFQQVEQGKSHRRGTGLGLTFCRLTIEAHGGSIWIEDNVAGGSVFAFTLPMAVS